MADLSVQLSVLVKTTDSSYVCHHPVTLITGRELAVHDTILSRSWPAYIANILEMLKMLPDHYMDKLFPMR